MKIQCDVCGKEEASVFCTADEAALCGNCDDQVHNANKLASKHRRFSLLNPQVKESQLCDICQERRALLFCQEDRALLCKECDMPIHLANELTRNHNRFLLTGIRLSTADSYQGAASSNRSQSEAVNPKPNLTENCSESSTNAWRDNKSSEPGSDSTSTISEYFMEKLPGWHVEDLLDPSDDYGFCKINKQMALLMKEGYGGSLHSFPSKDRIMCIPHLSISQFQTRHVIFPLKSIIRLSISLNNYCRSKTTDGTPSLVLPFSFLFLFYLSSVLQIPLSIHTVHGMNYIIVNLFRELAIAQVFPFYLLGFTSFTIDWMESIGTIQVHVCSVQRSATVFSVNLQL